MAVHLRPPDATDEPAFLAAVARSRRLHHPWTSPPATPLAYQAWLHRAAASNHCAWLVINPAEADALVGVINLSQIMLGPLCQAFVGYSAFEGQQGRGLMRAGLALALRHGFDRLKLHRIEANVQPGNARSKALVASLGFQLEGFSPAYLKIGGRWRDHERWALRRDLLVGHQASATGAGV